MKDCNASANTQHLKGEPRKEFMSVLPGEVTARLR